MLEARNSGPPWARRLQWAEISPLYSSLGNKSESPAQIIIIKLAGHDGETPSLLKIQKISWAWWWVLVVPATRETAAGELLELRRWRLQ